MNTPGEFRARHWEVANVLEQLERWHSAARRSGRKVDPEARDWRWRLARLRREASRHERAGDADWFWWLAEYAAMISATLHEDVQRFEAPLLRAMRVDAGRAKATHAAAVAKKSRGEEKKRRVLAGEQIVGDRQVRRYRNVR